MCIISETDTMRIIVNSIGDTTGKYSDVHESHTVVTAIETTSEITTPITILIDEKNIYIKIESIIMPRVVYVTSSDIVVLRKWNSVQTLPRT